MQFKQIGDGSSEMECRLMMNPAGPGWNAGFMQQSKFNDVGTDQPCSFIKPAESGDFAAISVRPKDPRLQYHATAPLYSRRTEKELLERIARFKLLGIYHPEYQPPWPLDHNETPSSSPSSS